MQRVVQCVSGRCAVVFECRLHRCSGYRDVDSTRRMYLWGNHDLQGCLNDGNSVGYRVFDAIANWNSDHDLIDDSNWIAIADRHTDHDIDFRVCRTARPL